MFKIISQSMMALVALGVHAADLKSPKVATKEIQFSPQDIKLSHQFSAMTQAGEREQSLELRQVLTKRKNGKFHSASDRTFYLIHHSGDEYGSYIINTIKGIAPIMRVRGNAMEIFYVAGANTHVKQIWQIGTTPKKVFHERIEWYERPGNEASQSKLSSNRRSTEQDSTKGESKLSTFLEICQILDLIKDYENDFILHKIVDAKPPKANFPKEVKKLTQLMNLAKKKYPTLYQLMIKKYQDALTTLNQIGG